MAGRYVRTSSFRHVHGETAKPEQQFMGNLRASGKQISANDKYFAVACTGGGGPVAVGDLNDPGRHNKYFQIQVHSGAVEQAEFSPFAVNLLATASADAYIKLSTIPQTDNLKEAEPVSKADRELQGHFKKVDFIKWHPTASNVIASASSDNMVKFWDIEAQAEYESFAKEIGSPTCLNWNANGSQVVVGSKDDGKFYIYDPRAPDAVTAEAGFGKKAQGTEYVFADDHGLLIGVGRSSGNARRWKLWDLKKLDTPTMHKDIDQSAGILCPFFDPDNSILYLAGCGDSAISYWELSKGQLHFLTSFSDSKPHKVVAWRPKRSLNVKTCEIAGALRLMAGSGVGSNVVPVSFQVPRKSDLFQKDLYPETYAGIATATSEEWKAGKDGEIKKQSMKPGESAEREVTEVVKKKTPTEYEAEIAELQAEIARLKAKCGE